MESWVCPSKQIVLATAPHHHHSFSFRRHPIQLCPHKYPIRTIAPIYSKPSDFQDFQDYAKPSRLLPASEVKICTETSLEKKVSSLSLGKSHSLYMVKLQTSRLYGSSLSDLNSGILLCLIDENGDSILQRIPACPTDSESMADPDKLCFQMGSVDEFTFKGSKLGRIVALWISLESGQWRLGGLSLTVISDSQPSFEKDDGEAIQYVACQYNFEVEDILLGEGSDTSMVELRPRLTSESFEADPSTLLSKSPPLSTSLLNSNVSNEESMREYADLKFSLLFYDAMLISVGSTILFLSAGENVGFAFFTGGVGGFLYLWLLQRSVDGLPVAELKSRETGGIFDKLLSGLKSPISSLALAIGFAGLAVKFGSGDVPLVLSPTEVVVGMMGFLACKVAVVLAAVNPLPTDVEANK